MAMGASVEEGRGAGEGGGEGRGVGGGRGYGISMAMVASVEEGRGSGERGRERRGRERASGRVGREPEASGLPLSSRRRCGSAGRRARSGGNELGVARSREQRG